MSGNNSKDIEIDWSDKKAVLKYYNSFEVTKI
jgi:hypothetical protein